MVCLCLPIILLIIYIIWDVNYFLRFIFTIGWGKLFQKKVKILEKTTIYGFCTTQDVDIFVKHMNNARYLRELDFARFHYYVLTGLYEAVKKVGGGAVQGASNIRYRRAIPIFQAYKVETKLIWWDEKAIYLEQKFITTSDNFVRAIAISKQCVTKASVQELLAKFPGGETRPECPEDLRLWLQSSEISSQKLRGDKTD
ncbi:Protein THEM6 [Sergentomyia squamirostris]